MMKILKYLIFIAIFLFLSHKSWANDCPDDLTRNVSQEEIDARIDHIATSLKVARHEVTTILHLHFQIFKDDPDFRDQFERQTPSKTDKKVHQVNETVRYLINTFGMTREDMVELVSRHIKH